MNKIKTFRQMYKISQLDLAKVLNTTQQQISLYETGRRKLDEDQIVAICRAYKVSPLEILRVEEPEMGEKSNATKYKIWSAPNIQKGYPAYF